MEITSLLDMSKQELEKIIVEKFLEKPYRVKQILHWVYNRKEENIDRFSDLPQKLRDKLKTSYKTYSLSLISKKKSKIDSTVKYDFQTYDGHIFSTVFIPKTNRNVVCVSTQIGCSIGCSFCNSGKVKFIRNLSCGEIIEQVLRIEKEQGKIDSVLFMGMGEPLLNYENLLKSIKILLDVDTFSLSRRRITVSTVGIVPNIYRLAEENLKIKLALSLHSYNDEKRKQFVKNLKYGVKEILQAGIFYAKRTRTRLTIEYVLIKNKNDTEEDVAGMIELLKTVTGNNARLVKINLIPYNIVSGCKVFCPPSDEKVDHFKKLLVRNGFLTFVRKSYGADIDAACGQLGV